MKAKSTAVLIAGALIASVSPFISIAGGGHSDGHAEKKEAMTQSGGMHRDEEEAHKEENHEEGGDHTHSNWVAPPESYASLRYGGWDDAAAARRGKVIFRERCVACHGVDGKDTGPAAAALKHPPANLTNNFHRLGGEGDGYLFWRVTEGGTVEPFKSLESAMPPFGGQLTPQQRWDVLTYIHRDFHHGFQDDAD